MNARQKLSHRFVLSSLIDTLEQAKLFALEEKLVAARGRFEEVARSALPAAPDVWLDAMYGLAECQRVARDYKSAIQTYRSLLQRGCAVPITQGRFALSNRVAIIQSFLAIADISRLSLRFPTELLQEIVYKGCKWANQEIDSKVAQQFFELITLLLERNIKGPSFVIDKLNLLRLELKLHEESWFPIDHVIVELRLAETKLDACLMLPPPNPPAKSYRAYQWAFALSRLLQVRWNLMTGRKRDAKTLLQKLPADAECFKLYPEFKLIRASLSTEIDLNHGDHLPSRTDYWDQIHHGISQALYDLGDLSNPIWHLAKFILLHIKLQPAKSRFAPRKRQRPIDLASLSPVLDCLLNLFDFPWLKNVLISRGFSLQEIRQTIGWCKAVNHGESWRQDGKTFLERLSQVVRP